MSTQACEIRVPHARRTGIPGFMVAFVHPYEKCFRFSPGHGGQTVLGTANHQPEQGRTQMALSGAGPRNFGNFGVPCMHAGDAGIWAVGCIVCVCGAPYVAVQNLHETPQ